ncbi:hypothetical protein DAPPUDRAFT_259482 [Daphnia pulex]|jgi:hypothetical protein|uniref:Uncharacterized protein n=1 Tax=Daphnia pulex TaxID=6669 RepID=E9HHA5_DAPPU|nr:hypothetical protein DAPPUDRAFT_259482 [Daphnia pulex]|eukprot:EFX68830.1 hypothetical protein DAPPUDRAFT_259482 [Daphnia pulex]
MNAAPNAKKRRLELEFEREQAKLDEQRKLEDIRQQSQREQEDLTLQIEYQRQLEGLKSPGISNFKPRLSSTINDSDDENRPRGPWPKISITPFIEDSRTWPDFELSFGALIHNTRMPEDMKLLAFRDNLEPDVRRRVANLFVVSASYQTLWKALTERYGNLQAIMHAHVQELIALQPFSSGDIKSLVNMGERCSN